MSAKFYFTLWLSKIILRVLNQNSRAVYRRLERKSVKLITTVAHRVFNETCLNNKLLPRYTNIKLHDDAARAEPFVSDFRENLVRKQVANQTELIGNLTASCDELRRSLKTELGSELRYEALLVFLESVLDAKKSSLEITHSNKLTRLNNSDIFLKQQPDSVINLTDIHIEESIRNIFELGMSCHLRTKYDGLRKKIELEKLYSQIERGRKEDNIEIEQAERLRCELKRFGLRPCIDFTSDVLTKEQYKLVEEFKKQPNIVIRRADKSNTFVILKKEYYHNELDSLLTKENKFEKIKKDPTEKLKKKLNKLIEVVNAVRGPNELNKLVGHFEPGYLYGNPKIHKCLKNPPIRPIISQICTPTYEIAKTLNSILRKYIPAKFMIESTDEFLNILRATDNKNGLLASLDVESLFTNVPVRETINIILQNAYYHPDLKPPNMPATTMNELLLVCTSETPFRHINGDIYLQRDGVSMGSPLGPLFANFYMAQLENAVLEQLSPDEKPLLYCRYVDDIFLIVRKYKHLEKVKNDFEATSVLKFTYEIQNKQRLSFLDVSIDKSDGTFNTTVHTKETSSGECLNYRSLAPQKYKVGVIRTMLHRAYKIASSWEGVHEEMERLRKLFTNNNFPMALIEQEIKLFLNRKIEPPPTEPNSGNTINLFYRNQMSSQHKQEERNLRRILKDHISHKRNGTINLSIYYKSRKLRNLFIKNNIHADSSNSHVVYQYECPNDLCQQSTTTYIGYTTNTIKQRMTMHAQTGSIISHHKETHNNRPRTAEIMEDVSAIFKSRDKNELLIAEALLIKDRKPCLNNQNEGNTRILHIF